ncbi:DUF1254 domain-containing protein [Trinickia dinghuensis]|uniref:DUF1254 domain-containing protein n=1 Tax=Trinickia dinghuensis TaxID=2291023 RepID=A0A3D8K700_9BURK|nr:DUF1214 domain-containing protein [Trinickia dinghuensis]RDV00843.1 DUF1254 domain-containing protein [Trinickia dinghuensis]
MTIKNRKPLLPVGARPWLACVAAVVFAGCAAPQKAPPASSTSGWTQDEVVDSYVFGYPLVVMSTARAQAVAAAGTDAGAALNTLHAMPMTETAGDDLPPLADVDTLSANAWLDLSQEPVIVSVPNTRGRFLDARVLDMWTNVVWSTGAGANARTGAPKAQTIALVPPGWDGQLPSGVERVDAPSKNLWLGVRIAALDAREVPWARRLLNEVRVAPLSAYVSDEHERHAARGKGKHGKRERIAARDRDDDSQESVAVVSTGLDANAAAVTQLDANGFFGKLADAMRDNPPSDADGNALKELADIGVKPGDAVHFPNGSATAIAAGVAAGVKRVQQPPVNAVSGNGWSWTGDGTGNYRDDYALRAYATVSHAGAATSHDEVFPTALVDGDGKPLDGSNDYVMHFTRKALPPARAYWTITAYTPDGALVAGHVPHRSIDSHDRLRRNRDGSIDIYVSSKSPGRAHAANWLPAPEGPFQLVMRLYAPQASATDGSWMPPAVVRR